MRFAAPSVLEVGASTNRGLASAASFRPRRFSRPRRFAPLSTAPRFPRVALMGFAVLQGSPASRWATPSPARPSPLDLPAALLRLSAGSRSEDRSLTAPPGPSGSSLRGDRTRQLPVSRTSGGPSPSWTFLLWNRSAASRRWHRMFGSRHVPVFNEQPGSAVQEETSRTP